MPPNPIRQNLRCPVSLWSNDRIVVTPESQGTARSVPVGNRDIPNHARPSDSRPLNSPASNWISSLWSLSPLRDFPGPDTNPAMRDLFTETLLEDWQERALAVFLQVKPMDVEATLSYFFIRGLETTLGEDSALLGLPTLREVAARPLRLEKMPPVMRQALWDELRTQYDLPPTYSEFHDALTDLGPWLPRRVVSLPAALRLLESHERLARGAVSERLTVVVGPTEDWNGAFTSDGGFPLLDTLLEQEDQQVLYFEASDEREMLRLLQAVRLKSGRDIDVLIVAGHGTPFSLALGDIQVQPQFDEALEGRYLTPEDVVLGDLSALDGIVAPEGEVILYSCSTGLGGAHVFNLANAFALALPGRSILSPQADTNMEALFPGTEKQPWLVKWRGTSTYLAYRSPGTTPRIPLRQMHVLTQRVGHSGEESEE